MSPEECDRLLEEERILVVATLGRDGWPHLMPLWYVVRGSEPWIFTYAKSQKVRNLERDPRATLLVETGDSYDEVRGLMLRARAELHRDLETVAAVGEELFARYERAAGKGPRKPPGTLDESMRQVVRERAAKRVAVQFRVESTASWDHAKLAGGY